MTSTPARATAAVAPPSTRSILRSRLRARWRRLRRAWRSRRELRQLDDLDDRLLRDVGVDRAELRRVLASPFWHERMPGRRSHDRPTGS